jgi:hypothetical protein
MRRGARSQDVADLPIQVIGGGGQSRWLGRSSGSLSGGAADHPNRRPSDLCKIARMTAILRKQLPVADATKRIPSLGVSSSRLGPPSAALFYRASQLDLALDP